MPLIRRNPLLSWLLSSKQEPLVIREIRHILQNISVERSSGGLFKSQPVPHNKLSMKTRVNLSSKRISSVAVRVRIALRDQS